MLVPPAVAAMAGVINEPAARMAAPALACWMNVRRSGLVGIWGSAGAESYGFMGLPLCWSDMPCHDIGSNPLVTRGCVIRGIKQRQYAGQQCRDA